MNRERDVSPDKAPEQPDNRPNGGMRKSGSGGVKGGDEMRPGQSEHDARSANPRAATPAERK